MSSAEETALIERCQRGENRAWDELFDLHYAPTSRFIYQLGYRFTWEDVEEICQETFVSAIRNLTSFKGDCQLQTWLFQIASNKARDYLEKQCAVKRGGGKAPVSIHAEDAETGLTIDPPSGSPTPDENLLGGERTGMLMETLQQIGDPCRELIELRYFGDASYEEIALALRLNAKTVSSRLSRCLDKLGEIAKTVFGKEELAGFSV
ncbi:MAG: sigma-70 family RNA polymerase sigma factor [Verrucomicrobiae bacterium]|nr:sigma-70 family RNA polymerase sigma factor [Verrucomicrobiae bacterium]